jgi:hypothetical protein
VANGSIGAQTFLDTTVTVTAKSDTNNVGGGFAQFNEIDFMPGAATLAISGIGSGAFDDLVYIVDNYGSDVLLLGGLFPSGNADIIKLTDADLGRPVFSNYFLTTSLGPIGPAPDEVVASWQNIPTTLGDVSLTTYGAISFQTTVGPEPSGQSLFLMGLFATGSAALLMRRGRRRCAVGGRFLDAEQRREHPRLTSRRLRRHPEGQSLSNHLWRRDPLKRHQVEADIRVVRAAITLCDAAALFSWPVPIPLVVRWIGIPHNGERIHRLDRGCETQTRPIARRNPIGIG